MIIHFKLSTNVPCSARSFVRGCACSPSLQSKKKIQNLVPFSLNTPPAFAAVCIFHANREKLVFPLIFPPLFFWVVSLQSHTNTQWHTYKNTGNKKSLLLLYFGQGWVKITSHTRQFSLFSSVPIALAERISLLFPAKIFLRRTHLDFALEDFFFRNSLLILGGKLQNGTRRSSFHGENWGKTGRENTRSHTHTAAVGGGGWKAFPLFRLPSVILALGKLWNIPHNTHFFTKKNQENPKESRDDHRTRPNLGPGSSAPGECSEPIDGGGPPDDNPLPRPDGQRARSPSPCPERHSASTGFRNRPPGRGPGRAHARSWGWRKDIEKFDSQLTAGQFTSRSFWERGRAKQKRSERTVKIWQLRAVVPGIWCQHRGRVLEEEDEGEEWEAKQKWENESGSSCWGEKSFFTTV